MPRNTDSRGNPAGPENIRPGDFGRKSTNLENVESSRTPDDLRKALSEYLGKGGSIVNTMDKLRDNWDKIAEKMYKISKTDAENIDQIFGKMGTKQEMQNMKMADLMNMYKEYEKYMNNIVKNKEKIADLTVGEKDALRDLTDSQKSMSRMTEEEGSGKKKIGVPDVLRGVGQIPGMGMVGELGGMMAGGFSVMTMIDAVGKVIKLVDGLIGQEREYRRALAMPGLVIPEQLSAGVAESVYNAVLKSGIPDVTLKGIEDVLKSLKMIPGLTMSEGVSGPVGLLSGIKDMSRELSNMTIKGLDKWFALQAEQNYEGTPSIPGVTKEVSTENFKSWMETFRESFLAAKAMPEGTEGEVNAKRIALEATINALKKEGGALAQTPEENKRYNELYKGIEDYGKNLSMFVVNLTKLQDATGVSAQETVRSLQVMSDAGVQLGKDWKDWFKDLYAVQVSAKESGRVYEQYLPDVIGTFNHLKYFGKNFFDSTVVLNRWNELLRKGSITVEELNNAYERAKGFMSLDELMLDFQVMDTMVREKNNPALERMFDSLKESPEKLVVFYKALLEGGNAMTALQHTFGIGVKDELVKAAGGIEEYNKAIALIPGMREDLINSYYKLASGGDKLVEAYLRISNPQFGIEKGGGMGQSMEKWTEGIDMQNNILQGTLTDTKTGLIQTYETIGNDLATKAKALADEVQKYTERPTFQDEIRHIGETVSLAVGSAITGAMTGGKMKVVIVGYEESAFGGKIEQKNQLGGYLLDKFNKETTPTLPFPIVPGIK